MSLRSRLTSLLVACFVPILAVGAQGQPAAPRPPAKIVPPVAPPDLVGLVQVASVVPERGFIDDPMATDGKRLAVILTDGAALAEAVVYGEDGVSHERVNLAPLIPTVRRLYLLGSRMFVVADDPSGGPVDGVLVELNGKVTRRHARATDLTLRREGGKDLVVAYTRSQLTAGSQHQLAAFDLVTGKRVPKRGAKLLVGADGRVSKLDLLVEYWLDDHSVVAGRKAGVWRKREDQRSPDTSAQYSLFEGKWAKDEPILDLRAHARATSVLADHSGKRLFLVEAEGGGELELWRDGVASPLALDQPLTNYDLSTMQVVTRDAQVWVSLVVDPVNPDAVARQKADPEYLDLFQVEGGKATRRGRIYTPKKKVTWGWAGDTLWVLEKNVGFGRGGKALRFLRLGT